ncbi:MAG: hypothetical protein JSS82_06120 [Bacteroidetes bacterium]|nr:hypothetical protein [Bacteroidota bacterium]
MKTMVKKILLLVWTSVVALIVDYAFSGFKTNKLAVAQTLGCAFLLFIVINLYQEYQINKKLGEK